MSFKEAVKLAVKNKGMVYRYESGIAYWAKQLNKVIYKMDCGIVGSVTGRERFLK